jgi:hypothetical protein
VGEFGYNGSREIGSTHICGVKTALIPILTALLIKSGTPTFLLGAFWQSSGAKARRDPTNLRRPGFLCVEIERQVIARG